MKRFLMIVFVCLLSACQIASPIPPSVRPEIKTAISTPEPRTLLAQQARLYAGPSNTGFEVLAELKAGTAVHPLGIYGDFVKVETGDQLQGYLWREQLENLPTQLTEIQTVDIPKQPLDLLPLILNRRLIRGAGGATLDNSASAEWYGADFGPFPVGAPFTLTFQAGMEGDFAGILLYGSIPDVGQETRPTMIILPDGRIQFQDGITYDTHEISIAMPKDHRLVFEFQDSQGRVFEIQDSEGQTLQTVDVTKDIPNLLNQQGLFPFGQLFVGLQTSPGSKLTIEALSLGRTPDGKYDLHADQQCVPVVEDSETVATRKELDAAGLLYWPDGVIGFLWDGGSYVFLAGNSGEIGRTTGTLDQPMADSAEPNIVIQQPKQHFDYASGGPVYRDPSGMLLMVYHAETWLDGTDAWVSSLGMAKSEDAGKTWQDLGIILTPNLSEYLNYPIDMGSGSIVVNGDYFYIYFRDALQAGETRFDVYLAVARAKITDVVDAARTGNKADWFKYYHNVWDESGLGGKSSPLEEGNAGTSVFDVKYSASLARYVAVIAAEPGDNMTLYYTDSVDGIYWSARIPIDESTGDKVYPSIVGLGEDPQIIGGEFYVYFVSTPDWFSEGRWPNAVLMRRKISCSAGIP